MVVKMQRLRYILVKFLDTTPNSRILSNLLREKIKELSGILFLAKTGLFVMDNENENYLIIRCSHTSRDLVEASLQLISDNFPLRVISVSGTIKKIKSYIPK